MKFSAFAFLFALVTSPLFAATYTYDCENKDNSFFIDTVQAVVKGDKVTINDHELTLDEKYNHATPGYERYEGDTGFFTSEEYVIEVLVNKTLLKGAAKSTLIVQGRGEDFEKTKFACVKQ